MNQKVVIGLVVVVLLIAGFFMFKNPGSMDSQYSNTTSENETTTVNPTGKKMAFDAFLKQGGSYTCTVHQNINNVDSVGTIYASGENLRGEFDMTVSGQKVMMSFISKDGFYYSWSSMNPTTGFKIAISATGNPVTNPGAPKVTGNFDASQIGDYDCNPWTADSSKFVPPSSVKFTDMSSLKMMVP